MIRKIVGWSLIVIGGAYPLLLVLLGLFALFVLISTGKVDAEHLAGIVWPLAIVVSALFLFVGIKLVRARRYDKEEADDKK